VRLHVRGRAETHHPNPKHDPKHNPNRNPDRYPDRRACQVRNEKARRFLANMRRKPGVNWEAAFPRADVKALALLRRLLAFDPCDRPSAGG
jgi:hypothetical protein